MICRNFRLPSKTICAPTTRLACLRCRGPGLRIHASSGTTGKPTVVGYSPRDIETWAGDGPLHAGSGCQPGMLAQNSYGYGLFTGGHRISLRRRAVGHDGSAGIRRDDRTSGAG